MREILRGALIGALAALLGLAVLAVVLDRAIKNAVSEGMRPYRERTMRELGEIELELEALEIKMGLRDPLMRFD